MFEPIHDDEDPQAGPTFYIGVIGIILVALSIVFCHAVYYGVDSNFLHEDVLTAPADETVARQNSQLDRVNRYSWSNRRENLVGVPVAEAKQRVIEKYSK